MLPLLRSLLVMILKARYATLWGRFSGGINVLYDYAKKGTREGGGTVSIALCSESSCTPYLRNGYSIRQMEGPEMMAPAILHSPEPDTCSSAPGLKTWVKLAITLVEMLGGSHH